MASQGAEESRDGDRAPHVGRRRFLQLSSGATLAALSGPRGARATSRDSGPAGERTSANPPQITLFLCGDVMTGRGIDQVLPQPGSPRICERYLTSAKAYVRLAEEANGPIAKPVAYSYIWGDALTELARRSPDLRIINLETSITRSEDCSDKGISYRMSPANLPCLTAAEIDCCVLANNHVLDWGEAGLLETLETLDGARIKRTGAGRDLRDASAPAILEVPGKGRVLVFSFGTASSGILRDWTAGPDRPGVNLLRDLSEARVEDIAAQVRAASRPGDIVVASIHWGENWGYHVPRAQRAFARGLIDRAGVDVVHGHSSHHPKAIEVHNDRPILYGCGDFLNDYEGIGGQERFRGDLALIYLLGLAPGTGKLLRCDMVPFQIKNFRLNRSSGADARWLRDLLSREGESFGTGAELLEDGSLVLSWR